MKVKCLAEGIHNGKMFAVGDIIEVDELPKEIEHQFEKIKKEKKVKEDGNATDSVM